MVNLTLMKPLILQEPNPVTGTDQLINSYINDNSSYSTGVEVTSQNYMRVGLTLLLYF